MMTKLAKGFVTRRRVGRMLCSAREEAEREKKRAAREADLEKNKKLQDAMANAGGTEEEALAMLQVI